MKSRFEEDLELHEFVKATASKLRDEHLDIIDILKYRAQEVNI